VCDDEGLGADRERESGARVVKIGIVSPYDWSYPGGVKSHITHLAAELRARGNGVRILTPATGPRARQVEYGIYKLGWAAPLRVNGSVARVAVAPDLNGHIRGLLERERFDILHLHEPLASVQSLSILHHAALAGAVPVGTFHAAVRRGRTSTAPEWAYASARPFLRSYVRRLQGRIAVSEAALDLVARFFPGDYRIIPNGIDVGRFAKAEPLPEFRDDKVNILFVGRIEKRKGLKHLLRALPLVREHVPNARLIVVGEGELRPGFQRLVERKGWPDVVFAGRVADEDLPAYFASADVFCAPSIGAESQGIVLLEALAAGVPTIASDIPGYRTVIRHDVDGLLVPPGDYEQLAWALCYLLMRPPERARLGTQGRARAELYTWQRVTTRIEAYYAELLALRAAVPRPAHDVWPLPRARAATESLTSGLAGDDVGV
jgi:phosphatidylinositol alpha-mannosyltransferase